MKTDMSPQAITMRIKKTSELRHLCIALAGNRLKDKFKQNTIHGNGIPQKDSKPVAK